MTSNFIVLFVQTKENKSKLEFNNELCISLAAFIFRKFQY